MNAMELKALAKQLGVKKKRLRQFGLARDVTPLARNILIGQLKRATKVVSIETGHS